MIQKIKRDRWPQSLFVLMCVKGTGFTVSPQNKDPDFAKKLVPVTRRLPQVIRKSTYGNTANRIPIWVDCRCALVEYPVLDMEKRIVVADDNAAVRHALRSILELKGDWKVDGEAVDGRDAIEKAKQVHPDLIVLDVSMPVMNGIDAAK